MMPEPRNFDEFSFRRSITIQDYRDCEDVQRNAWGMSESRVVPLHVLRPINEKGGFIMVAYDRKDRPIGTTICFLGKHEEKRILYSHMTGVIPEFQSKGVGRMLKLKQRDYALKQGYDLICWTYDSMQSINNWFNLNTLGALARAYYVNYYGEMPDRLNEGLASDRFLAEWWIKSPRVKKRPRSLFVSSQVDNSLVANPSKIESGVRVPTGQSSLKRSDTVLVEIPYSYDKLRNLNREILIKWREETRELYVRLFKARYIATEVILDKSDYPRSFVKLERRPLERILKH
ncbi:MAG: GNAT family N-acetyltransferase [Candidatus Bathyarchaeia archaeon]